MTETTPTIYALCYEGGKSDDLTGIAFGPSGYIIASHISSSEGFAERDMVTSGWKDKKYDEECPDGWRVEWLGKVDDPIQALPEDLQAKVNALMEAQAAF